MARSSRSSRRPWWIVVLVVAATWLYNRYASPPRRESTSKSTSERRRREPREREPRERESSEREPRERRDVAPVEGGQLFTDVVIRVSDGDTVKLQRQGTVRLIGVDCPEKAQQGGQQAKEFTTQMLHDKTVQVELCAKQPTDRYGRGLAFIYLTDRSGRRVLFNSELVRQGYARVYSLRPCTVDENEWNAYYAEARAERRGLFQHMNEVPDAAAYRRRQRAKYETS